MNVKYSPDVDALLIQLSDKPVDHAEELGDFIVHYSRDGELVLLEIFRARTFVMSLLESMIPSQSAVTR